MSISPEKNDAVTYVPASALPPGATGVIRQICDHRDPRVERRLHSLGLCPGNRIVLVRKAPFGGPMVLRVADYDVALRPTEARCLLVDVD